MDTTTNPYLIIWADGTVTGHGVVTGTWTEEED